jgi:signal transduction histidine kinase
LQLRLAVRVMALYVVATVIVIGILMFRAYDAARSLSDQELVMRAADLAKYVLVAPNGTARLDLPARLAASYDSPSATDIFAICDDAGRIVAASPLRFGELVSSWPPAARQPTHFDVRDLGTERDGYDGITIRLESSAGPLSISVGRSGAATALVYALLRKFIHDIIWAVSFLVLAALVIGILAIRSGLKPVRDVSEKAAAIGPQATSVRLPEENLPSEITPLVAAVNRALDRLDQGFAVQRQFTANAAHELRTPLAIITASLDAMEGNGELEKLKTDVARMNRLVEQLLRVARLDAIALDVSQAVDLNEVACDVVETMAPWALARKRTLAFNGAGKPVRVKGNAHAVADAIRNLVENAVVHSPVGAEALVSTHPDGSVSVADHGSGISAADQQRIFDRFWRGKNAQTEGAGLGLAIVQEIMKMHGGTIAVDNSPEGGAVFTLCFTADIGVLT